MLYIFQFPCCPQDIYTESTAVVTKADKKSEMPGEDLAELERLRTFVNSACAFILALTCAARFVDSYIFAVEVLLLYNQLLR